VVVLVHFELNSSLAGTLVNVPPVFFADSRVLVPEACPFAPTVVTSLIEFGPMNIVTALPDLSVAWTRNESGMTFTFVKPEFWRLAAPRVCVLVVAVGAEVEGELGA
jgi:hypothetical protein